MPDQERRRDRLKNRVKHLVHSLAPNRSRSASPNRPTRPTPDPQASSTPIGPDPASTHEIADAEPPGSPLSSSIYPSIVIYPAGDEAPGRMADMANSAGFQGLKTTLGLVESVSGVFPPLKSAIAGLLGVIRIMETTVQNQQDHKDLEQKLRAVVAVINNHAKYSTSPTFTKRLEGLSMAMDYQLAAIETKRDRSLTRRIVDGSADVGDIAVAYRTLSYLFDAFLIDITLETSTNTYEIGINMREIGTITQKILSSTLLNNLPQAKRAAYNAKSRAGRRSCTTKTREKVLADLVAWAADDGDASIYWLNGMAGTGKTTIAFTFSQILDDIQILGASFFCSHLDTDSSDADLIFPTLAYELARHSTAASNALLNALEQDRNVGYKSLRDQFVNLIVTPTKAASKSIPAPRPLVIVIDALDECANQSAVSDVLSIIRQYSSIRQLKFFITSRPERQIQNVFGQNFGTSSYSKFILHEIEEDIVSADIAIYAREELAIIAKGRMAGTPNNNWPPEDSLNTLVRLSGTLFIYAATACKYVGGGGSIVDRLADVTDISPNSANGETSALDDLYSRILSAAFERANAREKDEIQKVLRAVVSLRNPLSINGLSSLLKIKAENVGEALSSLHSVVYIPDNTRLPISTFHASFTDFITTEKRSRGHFLEPSKSHHMLALHCLGLLQSSLVENMCQLEGRWEPLNTYVSSLKIKDRIPEALAYGCVNWASHVANIKSGGEVAGEVWEALYSFFDEKLLQWVECLSLLTRLGDAVSLLQKLEVWAQSEPKLQYAVMDARRFITENFELVSNHPLETYSSALVWLPEQSRIRMKYSDKRKSTWKVVVGLRKVWGACEQVLRGHSDTVSAATFSPDGNRVVSGSFDHTVRIWNAVTGEPQAELKGHLDEVNSVFFSPDGSRVVSASKDNTVRIWNVATGESEAELKGHSGSVNTAVFSPDGSRVVSGSKDNTVRIWNVATGESEVEMEEHLGQVNSVVFSPDGSHVVSASKDNTARIWNVATGESEAELKGHSGPVNTAVCSPDGSRIVSGSDDSTMRIWNVATGESEAELKGHLGPVYSVVFSPDGSRVVSASEYSLCIWNVATGESEAQLKRYPGGVDTVTAVFSPDGSRVVSGSEYGTVGIWNVATGEFEAEFNGHSGEVYSTVFSPDDSRLLSASKDMTMRIWSVVTGETEAELGHASAVYSVVFSPDCSRLVSASDDKICIWNVVTGKLETPQMSVWGGNSVIFSPDGSHVVSEWPDKTIRVWNAVTGELEGELNAKIEGKNSFVFSRITGTSVTYGPASYRSYASDPTDCFSIMVKAQSNLKVELKGHTDKVNSVAFSPDGSRLVSGSNDHTVHIWNLATGAESEVEELKGHRGSVYSVIFSLDGSRVMSGSHDMTVRIWSVGTGETVAELTGHSGAVYSVALSHDGSRLASGSADGTIRIWNAVTGEHEAELIGHSGSVYSISFSSESDASHVTSVSEDNHTIHIWNIATRIPTLLADSTLLQGGMIDTQAGTFHTTPTLVATDMPSFCLDSSWVCHTRTGLRCWLPSQYRRIDTSNAQQDMFCIGLDSGVVLVAKLCSSDPS